MSAPTVTEVGYEIEERTTDDGVHIRAVDTSYPIARPGICGALQHISSDGIEQWGLLIYGGRDSQLLPLEMLPDRLAMVRTKESALQWVRCIATLYAKAVAA